MIRIGINGFGRIGRALFRINLLHKEYEIVAINEIDPDIDNMAYLLKYDSTYGKLFSHKISREGDYLVVDDKKIKVYHEFYHKKMKKFKFMKNLHQLKMN